MRNVRSNLKSWSRFTGSCGAPFDCERQPIVTSTQREEMIEKNSQFDRQGVPDASSKNPLLGHVRSDLPGRFNEASILATQWPRLAALELGQILPPYEILIHPSSACNLMCLWCIGDHVPITQSSNDQSMISILSAAKTAVERLPDVLRDPKAMMRLCEGIVGYRKRGQWVERGTTYEQEFRVEAVSFSGLIGEPLASKDAVLAAMHFLTDEEVRVGMFTNAVLMDDRARNAIIRTAYVLVSVDAANRETYGRLKYGSRAIGPIQFDRMMSNVGKLIRRRANTPESSLAINTAFILYPENSHELYEAARVLKEVGVDCLRVKKDISGGRQLNPEQQRIAVEQCQRIEDELVDENFQFVAIHDLRREGTALQQRRFSMCSITELIGAVGSDGQLYPCNYHPRPGGIRYGDATEAPFGVVWEGKQRARLKRGLPRVCPKVCDPFKSRANHLLEPLRVVSLDQGTSVAEEYRDEVLELVGVTREIESRAIDS